MITPMLSWLRAVEMCRRALEERVVHSFARRFFS